MATDSPRVIASAHFFAFAPQPFFSVNSFRTIPSMSLKYFSLCQYPSSIVPSGSVNTLGLKPEVVSTNTDFFCFRKLKIPPTFSTRSTSCGMLKQSNSYVLFLLVENQERSSRSGAVCLVESARPSAYWNIWLPNPPCSLTVIIFFSDGISPYQSPWKYHKCRIFCSRKCIFLP